MIILLWAVGALVLLFCFVVFFGAPYVPTRRQDLIRVFQEVSLPKDALVIDLGSGDGKMLQIAARKGYKTIGYEINPILWLQSSIRLRRYPRAKVKLKSFWYADVSEADLVFTFLATRYMPKLEDKLEREMKPGSYFASYVFALPNLKVSHKNKNTHFYRF